MSYSLGPTSPADTPVIAYQVVGAFAAPSLANATWYREKREGSAETTGVNGPSTALDMQGSTRFNYPGLRSAGAFAANPAQYILSDMKPGGSPQAARWLASVDFMTDAPAVEFRFNAPAATLRLGLIFINGVLLLDHVEATRTSGRTAGGGYSATFTFPSAATRRITIYDLNNMNGQWGGVAVAAGYSIWKPVAATKRVAFLGDSYTGGAGTPPTGASVSETYMWKLGILMGGDELINAGIGSTGFVTALSGQPTSTFAGRVSDLLAMQPDVLVIAGGRNDPVTGLQAAVESLLDSVSSIPQIYVMPTASDSAQTSVRDAISAACASRGVEYLSVDIDSIPKGADGIHPTWQGHQDLADTAFALMQSDNPGWTFTEYDGTTEIELTPWEWSGTTWTPLAIEEVS